MDRVSHRNILANEAGLRELIISWVTSCRSEKTAVMLSLPKAEPRHG